MSDLPPPDKRLQRAPFNGHGECRTAAFAAGKCGKGSATTRAHDRGDMMSVPNEQTDQAGEVRPVDQGQERTQVKRAEPGKLVGTEPAPGVRGLRVER